VIQDGIRDQTGLALWENRDREVSVRGLWRSELRPIYRKTTGSQGLDFP
jgi:hypothetical protein